MSCSTIREYTFPDKKALQEKLRPHVKINPEVNERLIEALSEAFANIPRIEDCIRLRVRLVMIDLNPTILELSLKELEATNYLLTETLKKIGRSTKL